MSRLFHAVVVAGAGLSVSSCGGKTQHTDSVGAGGSTAGGFAQSENQGQGGTSEPSLSSAGAGSALESGGTIVLGTAGGPEQGGGGAAPTPFDPDGGADLTGAGTFSQWSCGLSGFGCRNVLLGTSLVTSTTAHLLNQPCPIDPSRPRTAADCGVDQWFACDLSIWNDQLIAVSCSCVPRGDGGCDSSGCAGEPSYAVGPITCVDHSKLCGCAYTGIR
jgi:hypothetical protein